MKNSIFPKLVVAFLLVIAPLYALGLSMNKLGESSVREELSNSLQSRAEFYLQTLEAEKDHMVKLQQEYVIDQDLRHISFISGIMSQYEWSQTVLRIQDKLKLIKSSSRYIQKVSVHFLTIDRTISSDKPISDSIDDDYEAFETVSDLNSSRIVYWHNRLFLSISYPELQLASRKPSFVMVIEISVNELKRTLLKFTNYEHSGAALINPNQGWHAANDKDQEAAAYLSVFLDKQFNKSTYEGITPIQIGKESYLVAYKYSPAFNSYLSIYVPEELIFGKLDKYRGLFWLLSVLSTLVIFAYSYWIYRLIHKPLNKLVRSFRKVEDGQLEPMVLPRSRDEFLYLFKHFNAMVEKLKVLIHQVYEQKIRAQSSELKQLQSQINPHFLYNTYFILYRLAKINDIDNVIRFSQYLGEYFQFITRSAADEVTLETELKHSQTYVEIQNIRFSNRIKVEFDSPPAACKDIMVPRLVLQPIIENAYKYGLESKRKGGKIAVTLHDEGGSVFISIEDNGDKLTDDRLLSMQTNLIEMGEADENTGMLNVHRRLQLRFGEQSGIMVSRGEWGGLKVTMKIEHDSGENGHHKETID